MNKAVNITFEVCVTKSVPPKTFGVYWCPANARPIHKTVLLELSTILLCIQGSP